MEPPPISLTGKTLAYVIWRFVDAMPQDCESTVLRMYTPMDCLRDRDLVFQPAKMELVQLGKFRPPKPMFQAWQARGSSCLDVRIPVN